MPMLDRTASAGSEKAERRLRFSAGVELISKGWGAYTLS